jgi:hypothetical protein
VDKFMVRGKKERRSRIIIIIIRNGAKAVSLITIRGAILRLPNFEMSHILKMAAKIRYKKWGVKIQHCPISSKFDMQS